jgi:hypothetical protein
MTSRLRFPSRRERVYLLRIWMEPSLEQPPQLRGTVQDVRSGQSRHFAKLGEIAEFVEADARRDADQE